MLEAVENRDDEGVEAKRGDSGTATQMTKLC
jgi:hypothetical protein